MTDLTETLVRFVAERARLDETRVRSVFDEPLRDLLDSVDMIDLLVLVEKTFDIIIDDAEVTPETFESIASALAFLDAKVAEAAQTR